MHISNNSKHLLKLLLASILTLLLAEFSSTPLPTQAISGDWSSYLFGPGRSGYNRAEMIINPSSAHNLHERWHFQSGGRITTQAVEEDGVVYWGAWDGKEYAADLNGNLLWSTYLGKTKGDCGDSTGVASTATVVHTTVRTASTVVYVGGGNAVFYALDASDGTILWHTKLGPSPSSFIWSSPLYYNDKIYVGLSSLGDCPLVQGKLVQLDAVTGNITHTFNTVPDGCTGASIWGSPTLDQADGSIFFVTGNAGPCTINEDLAIAMVKVQASDLTYASSWQVPPTEQINDGDFGTTPTLFQGTIHGHSENLVSAINKNGIEYAFQRSDLKAGPVWKAKVADSGSCPQCGNSSIAPAAWDGKQLYVATELSNSCHGTLQAIDPSTGKVIWLACLSNGPILGAVSVVPGVAVVTAGRDVIVIATADGSILTTLTDTKFGSLYYGSASISNGMLYVGNLDGLLHAYGV